MKNPVVKVVSGNRSPQRPCDKVRRTLLPYYLTTLPRLLILLLTTLSFYHFTTLSLVFAAAGAGTQGAQFLNLGVSARSIAMGNAYAAVPFGGVIAANYNPAGLYGTVRPELALMHYRYILDSNISYVGYAQPLGKKSRVVIASNFIYGNFGSIEETQVAVGQDSGQKVGTNFSASDSAGTLTFAILPTKKLGLGINFKYVSQEIAGVRSSVPAGDIGLIYKMGRKLSFGFVVRNLGPSLKFDKETVPLPQNFVLGVSYALLKSEMLLFVADFEKPRNQDLTLRFGGELNLGAPAAASSYIPRFSLRAGHDGFNEAGTGLSLGGGMRIGNYSLDYAFLPFGQLGEAHRISAAIRFGKPKSTK